MAKRDATTFRSSNVSRLAELGTPIADAMIMPMSRNLRAHSVGKVYELPPLNRRSLPAGHEPACASVWYRSRV